MKNACIFKLLNVDSHSSSQFQLDISLEKLISCLLLSHLGVCNIIRLQQNTFCKKYLLGNNNVMKIFYKNVSGIFLLLSDEIKGQKEY